MKSTLKYALIAAAVLLAVGLALFFLGFSGEKFNLRALETRKCVTNTWEPAEAFTGLSITGSTEEIRILPAEDGRCRVVCQEEEDRPHTVTVEEGLLKVSRRPGGTSFMGISFTRTSITVYLPAEELESLEIVTDTGKVSLEPGLSFRSVKVEGDTGDLTLREVRPEIMSLRTDTGDITLSACGAESLELRCTTGDVLCEGLQAGETAIRTDTGSVRLKGARCGPLRIETTTGRVTLTDTVSEDALRIQTDTGDIRLEDCDAGSLRIRSNTGSVQGNLLSAKIYIVRSDTGEIRVPRSLSGGECDIETDTGDIRITQPE